MNILCRTFSLITVFSLGCTEKESRVDIGNRLQILHIGNGAEPATIDTHTANGIPADKIIRALFEGLVGANSVTLQPEPTAVAHDWTISSKEGSGIPSAHVGSRSSNLFPLGSKKYNSLPVKNPLAR